MYIADHLNNRVRKVTVSTGIITTIAGNGGTGGYSGDNGQATAASLYQMHAVELDATGKLSFKALSLLLITLLPPR